MNLRRAISYPYRNMPKIISMVLILGIALVVFASMFERGEEMRGSWPYRSEPGRALVDLGLAGLILTFPCFVAWLMGYSLEVIRHTGEGYRSLPAIHFFRNLASGLAFLFSRFYGAGWRTRCWSSSRVLAARGAATACQGHRFDRVYSDLRVRDRGGGNALCREKSVGPRVCATKEYGYHIRK